MKPYQFYVDQISYKFFRFDKPNSEVEKVNREAVKRVVDTMEKEKLKVINAMYKVNIGKLKERVEYTAKILNVDANYIWGIFDSFMKKVGKERGLI